MRIKAAFLCLCLPFLLLACTSVRSLPIFGPTATPTFSPTPTATATPTSTPTPTPSPTPVPAARVESGDRAAQNGDWDTALQEYETARQASQDPIVQAAALFGAGRVALLSGDLQASFDRLEALIADYPESDFIPAAHFLLGQSHTKAGQPAQAAEAYLNYMALRPGIIDGYVLDLRGDALFAAGDYAGAVTDFLAALQSPSLKDGMWIEMKAARSYALSGDVETALAIYDNIYARADDHSTLALVDLRKGQIYTSLGQNGQAYEAYLDAVNHYPSAYESYSALVELINAGIPVDDLQRGLVDYYAGEYGVATAAFDRYLQNNPAEPATAHYFYGLASRAQGLYNPAINQWSALIQRYPDSPYWDDAYEQKAYTQWAFLDQYTLAEATLLEFVASAPGHSRAGEFLFDAAQVAERSGKLDVATELWERVYSEYPGYEQSQRALLLAGISRYRMGDYTGAETTFQRLLAASIGLGDRASALLWIGKSQAARGDTAAATATWQTAAAADPTGYYSERARDLVRGRAPFTTPVEYDLGRDPDGERRAAEAWMRTTFGLDPGVNLAGLGDLAQDARLVRGTELWNLGLAMEARNEFEALRQSLAIDAEGSYRLAGYLAELGLYRSATLAARQVLDLAGMDDAGTLNAPMYFNRLRFGTYFSELVIPIAEEYDFHPLFVFSLIRQESLFESFVSSSAQAGGLMQIIPATGQDIADRLGWPDAYTDADRFRPLVNIRFGVDYLADQVKAFDGDLFAALAAYNGGPGNSAQWKEEAGGDPDAFVEVIRFGETRNYVRGIYEIYSLYRRLYARSP